MHRGRQRLPWDWRDTAKSPRPTAAAVEIVLCRLAAEVAATTSTAQLFSRSRPWQTWLGIIVIIVLQ